VAGPVVLAFSHRPFAALSVLEFHDVVRLRDEVFVVQQRITAEAEVDGKDPECVHVMGRLPGGDLAATARVFAGREPVKVGRVAVRPDLQRRGAGTALMRYVHGVIGGRPAVLSAQAYLEAWYARLGWKREGGVYDEAGIPHVRMTRGAGGAR
jgi:ElaA protein